MAKQRVKPIHLIAMNNGICKMRCDRYFRTQPIEALITSLSFEFTLAKGTFNPKKVTCKRCLKHPDYKIAMDKVKYPLLFWKESI